MEIVKLILFLERGVGIAFIFSGTSKLIDRTAFLTTLRSLTFLPQYLITIVYNLLPWIEFGLGVFIVMGALVVYAAILSLLMLAVFTIVMIVAMQKGLNVPCSCFGQFSRRPISKGTILRNLILILLLVPLIIAQNTSYFSVDGLLRSTSVFFTDFTPILLILSVVVALSFLVAYAERMLTISSAASDNSPEFSGSTKEKQIT